MKPLSTEQKLQLKNDCIAAGLLIGFAFFINREIAIKGLYMDDLYLWSCYGEQSFFAYVFPFGSTRFRFLYYLAAWLELALIGPHVEWIVPINIVLNGLLAVFLYYLGRRLSGKSLLGFFGGICFLMSRMAYYQIGQMYGLMETLALWLALGIFYCLFIYFHEKQEKIWYFHGACWLYFAVCFVHERYMALLPLFYLVLIFRRRFQWKKWFWPLRQFLLVQVIRYFTIGSLSPAGTGGTNIADTFSFKEAVRYAFSQVAYVFGINDGPSHLNGLIWTDTPAFIRWMVYGADSILAAVFLVFLVKVFRNAEKRGKYLMETALFLSFIALCIGSSSVTVRLEMRWVYISYAAALLFFNYICGVIISDSFHQHRRKKRQVAGDSAEANYLAQHSPNVSHRKESHGWASFVCIGSFVLYLGLMAPVELFFRGHFPNLYLWPNQMRYNSLAEETYGRYGREIFGKTIYIVGNSYEMSDFTAETFFKVFDRRRKAEGTNVIFIDSIRDIGLVTDQMLVIREDPDQNGFQDITQFVKKLKFDVDYGYYPDGWMDEECSFSLLCGEKGEVHFRFLYPGLLSGKEKTEIYVDGELYQEISVNENIYYGHILAEPYQTLEIEIKSNFFVENAQEQRGEKKLTALVEIKAE